MTGTTTKITERAEEVADKAKGTAQQVADKAKEMAHEGAAKASDVASQAADKARDLGKAVADKASEVAGAVGHKADDAVHSMGSGLKSVADKVRESAPHNGMLGSAAGTVADGIEKTGEYLKNEGFSGMSKDVATLVRAHPIHALLIGIGLGYIVARATKA